MHRTGMGSVVSADGQSANRITWSQGAVVIDLSDCTGPPQGAFAFHCDRRSQRAIDGQTAPADGGVTGIAVIARQLQGAGTALVQPTRATDVIGEGGVVAQRIDVEQTSKLCWPLH